jgi:hypothetical protein
VLKISNTRQIIPYNDHVINIKNDKNNTYTSNPKKKWIVIGTRDKALLSNNTTKFSKLGSRSLLETVESTAKTANFVRMMVIARWRMHINFLSKITIQDCIFDIHLK